MVFERLSHWRRGAATVGIGFALFGCSSSIFTGGKGNELDSLKGTGRFNKACLGLDLSQETLNVPTTRALVNCLNSNNSIPEYANLVQMMSDSQLGAVIGMLNANLLTNHVRMKELDRSFSQMDERGILDRSLSTMSKVLAKPKLLRSALKLMRQGSSLNPDGSTGKIDPAILASIRILAEEVSQDEKGKRATRVVRANAGRAFDTGISTLSTKSYQAIVSGLQSTIPLRYPTMGLRYFSDNLVDYFQTKIKGPNPLLKTILWGVEDSSLLTGFDYYYGSECEESPSHCQGKTLSLDEQVQATEALMRTLNIDHKEDILKPTINLFRTLDAPVKCMASTKEIPNADMYVMNEFIRLTPLEVPEWASRTNLLKIKTANSMCEFPVAEDGTGFNDLISVLRSMSTLQEVGPTGIVINRRPLVTTTHLLKSFEVADNLSMSPEARADMGPLYFYPENERFRRFMIHWLGDKSPVNVYTSIADAIGEITRKERSVLGNVFYLLNAPAPDSPDRENLRAALRAVMTLRPELKSATPGVPGTHPQISRSVYDVLSNAFLKADKDTIFKFFSGISELIDSPDDFGLSMMQVTRDALLMNDVSPTVDLLLDVALDAEKNEALFNALFDIADTDQFEAAMRLTAKMAKEGTLKELLQGMLVMVRSSSNLAPGNPIAVEVPACRKPDPARDKSTASRPAWNPVDPFWPPNTRKMNACFDINVDVKTGSPFPPTRAARDLWSSQMGNVAACINANNDNQEVEDVLNYSLRETVRGTGKSALGYLVEVLAGLIPDRPTSSVPGDAFEKRLKDIYDELSDVMTDNQSFRDLKDFNGMLPFLFKKKYCPEYSKDPNFVCPRGAERIAPMQGIARALSVLTTEEVKLHRMLGFTGTVVQDRNLPKSVALLYDVADDAEFVTEPVKPDEKPPLVSYPIYTFPQNTALRDALISEIRSFEKHEPTDAQIREVEAEYWQQPVPDKHFEYADYAGRRRFGYQNSEQLKQIIKPFLDEISRDYRLEWMLAFFYYFDHSPYTPEWWESWFNRGAAEVWPIPYYYPGTVPGKDKPKVRLVNLLDALDLVVADADFSLRELKESAGAVLGKDLDENTSIKYLTLLARSGDDMTPVLDAMQRELKFFGSIADSPLGFLLHDETKRRLYNLGQIYPIFRRINRVTEFTGSDGKKIVANDLGVLRDLFKAVLSATPNNDPQHNDHLYERDKNSLSVIAAMTHMGVLRNVSINLWRAQRDSKNSIRVVPARSAHIFKFLIDASVTISGGARRINADTRDLLHFLIRNNCDHSLPKYSHSCIGQDANEAFKDRYVFISKVLDKVFDWTKNDDRNEDQGKPRAMTLIKRSGYNVLTLFDRFAARAGAPLIPSFAAAGRPIFGSERGTKLIADNFDILDDLFTDSKVAHETQMLVDSEYDSTYRGDAQYPTSDAFKALSNLAVSAVTKLGANNGDLSQVSLDLGYKLYEEDPEHRFRAAMKAMDWISDDPDYKEFKNKTGRRVVGNLIHWLPKEETPSTRTRELRPRVQDYLAETLSNGKLRDLLLFIGDQSCSSKQDLLYKRLEFLGDQTYINKLDDFMDLLRSGIVDVYQVPRAAR